MFVHAATLASRADRPSDAPLPAIVIARCRVGEFSRQDVVGVVGL
jgi:hypothetical protein